MFRSEGGSQLCSQVLSPDDLDAFYFQASPYRTMVKFGLFSGILPKVTCNSADNCCLRACGGDQHSRISGF